MTKDEFIDLYIEFSKEVDEKTDLSIIMNKYIKPLIEDENVEHTWISLLLTNIFRRTGYSTTYILRELGAVGIFGEYKNKYYLSNNFLEFLKKNKMPFKKLIYNQNVNLDFVLENINSFDDNDIVYFLKYNKEKQDYIHYFIERILNFDGLTMSTLIKSMKIPNNIIKKWLLKNKGNKQVIEALEEKYSIDYVLENFIDVLDKESKNYILKNYNVSTKTLKKFLDKLDYEFVLQFGNIDKEIIDYYTNKFGKRKVKPYINSNKKVNFFKHID